MCFPFYATNHHQLQMGTIMYVDKYYQSSPICRIFSNIHCPSLECQGSEAYLQLKATRIHHQPPIKNTSSYLPILLPSRSWSASYSTFVLVIAYITIKPRLGTNIHDSTRHPHPKLLGKRSGARGSSGSRRILPTIRNRLIDRNCIMMI